MGDRTEYTCTDCDWSVSDRERPEAELSQLAIEHYVKHGHSVERDDEPNRQRWSRSMLL